MKKLNRLIALIILTFLSVSIAFGQKESLTLPVDSATNKITYSDVVHVDSFSSKLELFSRAKEWFTKTYKSSTSVIQMEDREDGKIIGKGLLKVYMTTILGSKLESGYINYTISIYTKDGRYKYEITDFYHTGIYINSSTGKAPDGGPCEVLLKEKKGFWGNSYKKTYESYLFQMDEIIKNLISDLNVAMTLNAEKDKW
jgi:hypothetical protein